MPLVFPLKAEEVGAYRVGAKVKPKFLCCLGIYPAQDFAAQVGQEKFCYFLGKP